MEYFNALQDNTGLLVLVVSDAPKAYCRAVLSRHGFKICDEHIYGGQDKPGLHFDENIIKPLKKAHDKEFSQYNCLVVGNSPKHIYFGHDINSPTVFTTWETDFDVKLIVDDIKSTCVANNLMELKEYITTFMMGFMTYAKPDFKQNTRTINTATTATYHLDKNHIGFAREYVPSIHLAGNIDGLAHYTWMDINFGLKLAKGFSGKRLNNGEAMPICFGGDIIHRGLLLKALAKTYFAEFVKWVIAKDLKGLVALVPVPSSVPKAHNLNSVISQICSWWAEWAQNMNLPCTLQVCDLLDRWKPLPPAHIRYLQVDERQIEPHLSSIGVVDNNDKAIPDDVKAVIIVDDVVTTGTQMNAVVTILRGLGLISANVSAYGYVWAKTVLAGR